MTPQQAIQYLDQVASRAPADRNTHATCQAAVKVLMDYIAMPKLAERKEDPKS